jgi:hypothetical protein
MVMGNEHTGSFLVIEAATPLWALARHPQALQGLLDGADGFMLVDAAGHVTAIVDAARLREEVRRQVLAPRTLGNDHQALDPPVFSEGPLQIRCAQCDTMNELPQFSHIKAYVCKRGHPLVPVFEEG